MSLKQMIGIGEYYIRFMSFEHSIRNAVSAFPMNYILKDLTGFTCILGDNTSTRSEFKQKILSVFTQITELYQERFEFFTGLGKIVSSMTDLPASYAQAQKAMEYRFIFPSQNILEVNALPGFDPKFILNQESEEDRLMELICRNDLESIRELVISFANSMQENMITREMVHLKLYSIAVRILKFSCEINISNDHLKQDILSVFSHTKQYRNIDEIAQWLLDICFSVCGCLQDSVSSYHSGLCESAIAYIRQNYADSNLNLNAIAEYVQITPAYLSTLFKKYCNQNISNFITDVRIDMACLLLRTTSDSLKSISLQVGYSNQYYFSSCFKKKMGVTPTAYREQADEL